jgi:hypothetical protein
MKPPMIPTEKKASTDWESIERLRQVVISEGAIHGRESDIVRMFKMCFAAGEFDDRLPIGAADTVVYEMSFKFGRADIVIFHVDGSASVIEVKDGTKGYNHVVAGIGQAGLYASQLAMNKGALIEVRKCLLWTSTGDILEDGLIERVCVQSNTVPLPWGKLSTHLSYENAIRRSFQE